MARPKSPYPFNRDFESLICLAESSIRKFHEVIGHDVDPSRMPTPEGQLLFDAAQAVAEKHNGCAQPAAVLQNLRMRVHEGKLTLEEMHAAGDLLDYAEDNAGGVSDLDALVEELIPIIKHFATHEAADAAVADIGRKKGPEASAERFAYAASIGTKRKISSETLEFTEEDIRSCAETVIKNPLPTGVPEIDAQIDGGLEECALGMILSSESGGGKTFFLCGIACESLVMGRDTVYITLEMMPPQIKNRIYRNLCDMTRDELEHDTAEASRRMLAWKNKGLGRLEIKYMSPGVTTMKDIKAFVRECTTEKKMTVRTIIIDYADKLVAHRGKKDSKHESMEEVFDEMRDFAIEIRGHGWTASQGTREAEGKKKLKQKHTANAIDKVRTADLVIAVSRTEQDKQNGDIRFNFPKRRADTAASDIGPLHTDWDHGRMVLQVRDNPWETK